MITRSIKEIPIATVDASSHRDLLTDRELMSSQLKSDAHNYYPVGSFFDVAMPEWTKRRMHPL